MADLNDTVASGLADYFEKVCAKLHKWVEPLSEEQFWTNPFPYGNDVGHLVLHLTGNLNYYIGAQIAKTGYVRDRPREFNDPNPPSKEEALNRFDDAIAMVQQTIRAQSPTIGPPNTPAQARTQKFAST
jgi:DinB superfamily